MFCEKCDSLMSNSGDHYVCPSCGFTKEKSKSAGDSGKIVNRGSARQVVIIDDEKVAEPLDSDAVCPKCKHVGAYFLLKQTRSADEPETKFYTCESCGHRWREY